MGLGLREDGLSGHAWERPQHRLEVTWAAGQGEKAKPDIMTHSELELFSLVGKGSLTEL